ncbi:MAG: hypothetical protein M3378_07420 [Actinomycetota bacterium]|nr:hypothetical protein [Actinomycetota bacterium]
MSRGLPLTSTAAVRSRPQVNKDSAHLGSAGKGQPDHQYQSSPQRRHQVSEVGVPDTCVHTEGGAQRYASGDCDRLVEMAGGRGAPQAEERREAHGEDAAAKAGAVMARRLGKDC